MIHLYKTLTTFVVLVVCMNGYAQTYNLESPDGSLKMTISTEGQLNWQVSKDGKPVINPSEIGMIIDGKSLGLGGKADKETRRSVDEVLAPVVPLKSSTIDDRFNELTISFKGKYRVEFRAYDDGVAYRFVTALGKREVRVDDEVLQVSFPPNTTSLFPEEESFISHNERLYKHVRLDTLTRERFCSLPVLMSSGDVRVLVSEADLYDYPGLFFQGGDGGSLQATFPKYVLKAAPMSGSEDRNEVIEEEASYIARTPGSRSFPWRVFVIGNEKTLLETNLVYQLSRPVKLKDTNWIKPGKVAWDWYNANNLYGVDFEAGINTRTYKYYIDFASAYGIEYVILDEGWTRTTTNIKESNPDVDVQELIAYGKERNVGIILWALWKPLDKDYKNILKLYSEWGAKGIKVDFMQRNDQAMVNYYEKIAAEAARNELLVDYHGAFKPSGLRRAYPNVISYEGVKGNENNKWSSEITPEHNVTLPFIRMVAGPMDYTPGAMANAQLGNHHISHYRPMSLGTKTHQVAMYIIYESPLQMLCDAPSAYMKHPEVTEFIAKVPVVWDETIALESKVADYVVIARRKGQIWYIGTMTDWDARELELDFSFLPEGNYEVQYVADGINAHRYAEDYTTGQMDVTNTSRAKISLAPGGGWAAIISPK